MRIVFFFFFFELAQTSWTRHRGCYGWVSTGQVFPHGSCGAWRLLWRCAAPWAGSAAAGPLELLGTCWKLILGLFSRRCGPGCRDGLRL